MEIALVLGFPLLGGLLLALFGHKRWAPELNALMSLITLVAAAALTRRVITDGPMTALQEQFFVDPFNVFLVALTASTLVMAYATGQYHLYYSAALTLLLKVILIPWILHRLINRLQIR